MTFLNAVCHLLISMLEALNADVFGCIQFYDNESPFCRRKSFAVRDKFEAVRNDSGSLLGNKCVKYVAENIAWDSVRSVQPSGFVLRRWVQSGKSPEDGGAPRFHKRKYIVPTFSRTCIQEDRLLHLRCLQQSFHDGRFADTRRADHKNNHSKKKLCVFSMPTNMSLKMRCREADTKWKRDWIAQHPGQALPKKTAVRPPNSTAKMPKGRSLRTIVEGIRKDGFPQVARTLLSNSSDLKYLGKLLRTVAYNLKDPRLAWRRQHKGKCWAADANASPLLRDVLQHHERFRGIISDDHQVSVPI